MTTPETMLQAIIEKQCDGGCEKYTVALVALESGIIPMGLSSLEILLDPAGLKAAYGGYKDFSYCSECQQRDYYHPNIEQNAGRVAHQILDTWLETSSPEKTIETAYSLLPTV